MASVVFIMRVTKPCCAVKSERFCGRIEEQGKGAERIERRDNSSQFKKGVCNHLAHSKRKPYLDFCGARDESQSSRQSQLGITLGFDDLL